MKKLPFHDLDPASKLAMQICSARLDTHVSSEDFSALVELLIETAREQGFRVGELVGKEGLKKLDSPSPPPPREDPDAELRRMARERRAQLAALPPVSKFPEKPRPWEKKPGGPSGIRALSLQDQEALYQEYKAGLGGRRQAPKGYIGKLLKKYQISSPTLYKIIREQREKEGFEPPRQKISMPR